MAPDDTKDDQTKPEATGADKRRHKRVDFHRPVKVVVPDDSTAIDVVSSNMSKGGIFLRASPALPEGKKVSLDIDTEGGQVKVEEGEVKWSKQFEPIDLDGTLPGMGVEFTKISPEAERSIGDLIDEVVGQDAGRAPPPVDMPAAPDAPDEGQVASPAQPIELPPDPEPIVSQTQAAPTWPPKASMKIPMEPKAAPKQPAAAAPKPAPADEDYMAALTKPPPPRTRMLIFVGFVLLVAVLTFLTLMWIKPFDEVTASKKPAAKDEPKPAAADKPPPPADVPAPAEDKPPAAGDKPPTAGDKPPAAEDKPPTTEDKPPAADDKAPPAASGLPVLKTPSFHKAGPGWRMSLEAGAAVGFKTFTLKAPPRLVIDVKGATWSGPSLVTSPAPFVSRIRFGKQPDDTIRLVLDFESGQIPKYAVTKGEDRLTIRFP